MPKIGTLDKRGLILQTVLGVLAATATGVGLRVLWLQQGLPDQPLSLGFGLGAKPGGLLNFVSIVLPACLLLPSLALCLLVYMLPRFSRGSALSAFINALRYDAATYLLLPGFLLLPLLWEELGQGFLALGLLFWSVFFLKAIILLKFVWSAFVCGAEPRDADRFRRQGAIIITCFVLFGLAALWHQQAISTASDEVGYLLIAHSLAKHGQIDPTPAVEAQEYKSFYWERFSKELIHPPLEPETGLFPLLIAPAYFLAGRIGVLLLFAGIMALLAGQLFAWLEECGLKPAISALSVGVTLSAAPVWLLSQQVYPDVVGMLLFVIALRLLMHIKQRPWPILGGLVIILGGLVLLKMRLAPLSLGLALVILWELAGKFFNKKTAWLLTLLAGAVLSAALVFMPSGWCPDFIQRQWALALSRLPDGSSYFAPVFIFIKGLVLDQNYGLLIAAPALVLALGGIAAGLRCVPRPILHFLLPALVYLAALCFTRWFQWYGGFAISGRFIVVILPPLALCLALVFICLQRSWMRLAVITLISLGVIYTWLDLLNPAFRFSRAVGGNNVLRALGSHLDVNLIHLFPSSFIFSPSADLWAAGTIIILLLLSAYCWFKAPLCLPIQDTFSVNRRQLAVVPVALWLLAILLIGYAKLCPPSYVEAEHLKPNGATVWAEWAYIGTIYGMAFSHGKSAEGSIYMPGGPEGRLTILGKANANGEIHLKLADSETIIFWRPEETKYELNIGSHESGYYPVTLTWVSCPERDCWLLVDRLEYSP